MPAVNLTRKKWVWRVIAATAVLTMLYIILYNVSEHFLTRFAASGGRLPISHQSTLEDEAKSVAVASAAREAVLTPKHSAAAWQLGIRIGYVSQQLGFVKLSDTANLQQAQAALEPMLKEARFFANFLQLDAPVAPMESQTLKEFFNINERIESDESGLATRIEQRVTVRHRHLFLLGMHVGVEMCRLDRKGAEQLPLSSIQIARHATVAGLPRGLWEPLSKAPEGGSLVEVKAAYRAAVAAASKYLTAGLNNGSR